MVPDDAQVQVLELPVKQNNLIGVVRSADGGIYRAVMPLISMT